jgi:hypothetical protein
VRAQQVELQGLQIGLGNALVGQLAKAGVDAIDSVTALCGLVNQVGAGTYAGSGGGVQRQWGDVGVQLAQLRQGEVAGLDEHGGFLKC